MKPLVRKIVETCIYATDLFPMKEFYTGILDLEVISEEKDKFIFLKAGSTMLLIFNPNKTAKDNAGLPIHGIVEPSAIHFALEISGDDFNDWKKLLTENNICIEQEVNWKSGAKSLYFRDPVGNLVELITQGEWPV